MANSELKFEIEKIKKKLDNQDKNMEIVFRYLDELLEEKEKPMARKRLVIKCQKVNDADVILCCEQMNLNTHL